MNFFHLGHASANTAMNSADMDFLAPVFDRHYGIYTEGHFQAMLTLERKRTERSKRPFILMLIDMAALPKGSNGSDPITKATASLASSTRETDIRGWYQRGDIIGVLFTELGDLDTASAAQTIHDRVSEGLRASLGPEKTGKIHLSLHTFPEELQGVHGGPLSDLILYPDLDNDHTSRKLPLAVKRAVDIVGSLFALVLFSPFFLLISMLIKLTSKGPVFYRQERIGQFGERFKLFKFRSMYANNDPKIHREYVTKLIKNTLSDTDNECGSKNDGIYKIKKDPRITSVGRFIRKTSLDELPQFLNVLLGHMSLVGPRPPIQYELECYDIWHRRRILEMKPGITGIWQVQGRSRTTFDEMVRMDLRYTREWSIWLDIKLMLQTPWSVLRGTGAY